MRIQHVQPTPRPTLRIDTSRYEEHDAEETVDHVRPRKRYDAMYEAERSEEVVAALPEYIRSTSLADAAKELDLPGYWQGPLPDGAHHVGHMPGMTMVGISHVAVLDTYGDPVAIFVNRWRTAIDKCEEACVALGTHNLYC